MPLTAGTRLGPYEVLAAIGAGGMGEVYRAHDHKLNRDVALKILSDSVAGDADRLARFRREAQVLASLNHQNIAAIYGFEDGGAVHALVLELVEGPTLADRLIEGPIPVADALAIARQIAEALAAAHELNIIHRDLKPANIKVRPDGTVKVLDFGLAKALVPEGATASSSAMNSPTLTARGTELGMILGTAAYMAPEQARGKVVDRRADLWAFGVVLYEMLTGRRAFDGAEVTDVLASVIKDTPSFDALPADVPTPVRRLLRRTLEKDRTRRLDSMAAARLELDETPDRTDAHPAALGSTATTAAPANRSRALAGPIALTALAAGLLVGAVVWWIRQPQPAAPPAVVRLALTMPPDQSLFVETNHNDVAITPDGTRILYISRSATTNAFISRPLGRFEGEVLNKLGTDARGMFLSTDGAWIGFQAGQPSGVDAVLRKAQIDGGASMLLTPIDGNLRGGTWVGNDSIVFATSARTTGLFQVPAAGGKAETLTTPSATDGELDHLWPAALPDGKHVVFTIMRVGGSDVGLLSLDTKKWRVLVKDGFSPRYISTGHVVYASGGSIRAVPFDLASLEIRGDSVEVQSGVVTKESSAADFAVSGNGTLVYLQGESLSATESLVWVEPGMTNTKETPVHLPPANYVALRVSPDGALAIAGTTQTNAPQTLSLIDLARETSVRLTPPGMVASAPVWSRDSKEIVFAVAPSPDGAEASGLFRMAVTGAAVPIRLTTAPEGKRQVPGAWTSDGRIIFSEGAVPRGGEDIKMLTLGPPPVVTTLIAGPVPEAQPALSPDGRWLAYVEVEGAPNVFVRPFPNVNEKKIPVSVGGGNVPVWGPEGHELFFHPDAAHVTVVPVVKTQPLTFGTPKPFPIGKEGRFTQSLPPVKGRVLRAVSSEATNTPTEYRVVLNWTAEVAARVKAKK